MPRLSPCTFPTTCTPEAADVRAARRAAAAMTGRTALHGGVIERPTTNGRPIGYDGCLGDRLCRPTRGS